MTIHSAKGLEFKYVFLGGMEEGIFPGNRAIANMEELEEERRLGYVAVTRARERLYVSHTKVRNAFGTTQHNIESRFLQEIPEELFEESEYKPPFRGNTTKVSSGTFPVAQQRKPSIPYADSVKKAPPVNLNFKEGDRVRHKAFGEGTVVSARPIGNDVHLQVNFSEGPKQLMAAFAKLEKV